MQKIEIVEYYPTKIEKNEETGKLDTCGSLHVYLTEWGLDLRGIWVTKKAKKWRFFLPSKITKDYETKEDVRFPILNFTDPQKNKDLLRAIEKDGKAYIREKYLDVGQPPRPKYYEKPARPLDKRPQSGKVPFRGSKNGNIRPRPMGTGARQGNVPL